MATTEQTEQLEHVPAWFEAYKETYIAGAAHGFVLTGDIYGFTTHGISQRAYLESALAEKRDIVVRYDRARGFSFVLESMQPKAAKLAARKGLDKDGGMMLDSINSMLEKSGASYDPGNDPFANSEQMEPVDALRLLETLLREPKAKGRVAVVLDMMDLLAPSGIQKAIMPPADRDALGIIIGWGQDKQLEKCNNPIFLLVAKLNELHEDIRSSGSGYKVIEVPLPDRADRLEYLTRYLAKREERKKTIPLLDLDIPELANLTAGLNLRHLEDILLLAYRSGGVSRQLVKARKDAIITSEFSEVAEMIEPLEAGFAALGGMEHLVGWAKTELIAPLVASSPDVPKGVLLVGPPGTGKAQPLSANVLTPVGWKRMGDLHVGDDVIDPTTGRATAIVGVYPQGKKEIYRVYFTDGTSVECCNEHLWLTQTRNARRDGTRFKVRTLAEIRQTLLSGDGHPNHYIPLTFPIEFDEQRPLPLDPYLLGVLIGDGHFGDTLLMVTTSDEEIVAAVREALPVGFVCERTPTSGSYDYNIRRQKPYTNTPWPKHSPLFSLLREMGMMGTRAADKHVPAIYLYASAADRLALLQGLLDTDGSVASRDRYSIEFGSNSRRLAQDVAFLVQSFGGTARIAARLSGMSYRVNVKLPDGIAPFRLSRKASVYQSARKYGPRRAIVSVELVGVQDAQCIAVASDACLYLTEHCIVTHNTFFVRALAKEVGFNAVMLRTENILSKYVGESEGKLKRFFDFARALSPVLVFFDELDQSDMSSRGGDGNPVARNLFNQMLQFMSDETLRGKMVAFFASNRPDLIDQALLRFGRMDAIIPVLLPDEAARAGIVLAQARSQGIDIASEAVALASARSIDFSAADLAAIVGKAKKLARRAQRSQIEENDIAAALGFIKPATPQIARKYTLLAVEACNDTELLPPAYAAELADRQALKAKIKAETVDVGVDQSSREDRSW